MNDFYEKLEINDPSFPVNMLWDVGWFNTNTYLLKERIHLKRQFIKLIWSFILKPAFSS